jgi:hypothetical protein
MLTHSILVLKVKSSKEKVHAMMAVCTFLAMIDCGDKTPSHIRMQSILDIFLKVADAGVNKKKFKAMYVTLRDTVSSSCGIMSKAMSSYNIFDHRFMEVTIHEFLLDSIDFFGFRLDDKVKISGTDNRTPTNRLTRAIVVTTQNVVDNICKYRSGKNPDLLMKCVVQFIFNTHPGLRSLSKENGSKDPTINTMSKTIVSESYLKPIAALCVRFGKLNTNAIDKVLDLYNSAKYGKVFAEPTQSPSYFVVQKYLPQRVPGRAVTIDTAMFPGASLKRKESILIPQSDAFTNKTVFMIPVASTSSPDSMANDFGASLKRKEPILIPQADAFSENEVYMWPVSRTLG